MALGHGTSIVRNGLVFHLDAANVKSYPGSGTQWKDLSTIGGTATAYNSPTFSNGAFNFDGASDYFQISSRSDLNGGTFAYTNITVELMYRPTSTLSSDPTGNNLITVENAFEISVGNNGNGYSEIQYASAPWAWYGTSGSNCLTNSKWNLITFVHATTGRWIYVNGVSVFYRSDNGNITAGSGTYPYLTLMGRYTGTNSPCEGDLSFVKLYNRALSATEIKQNFEAIRGRYGV